MHYRSEVDDDSDCNDENCANPHVTNGMAEPIYSGSNVTLLVAYCILMEFKSICRVSFSTMVMLLNLLQLLCPPGNCLPKTKYQLVKFAQMFDSSHSRIDYCHVCNKKLQSNRVCTSGRCKKGEPNSLILISPKSALPRTISGRCSTNYQYMHNELFCYDNKI